MTGYDPCFAGGVVGEDDYVLSKQFGPEEHIEMLARVRRSE